MMFRSFLQLSMVWLGVCYIASASAGGWVRQHVNTRTVVADNQRAEMSRTASYADATSWAPPAKKVKRNRPLQRALRLAIQDGKPMYLCRVPVGRSMYPGFTHGASSACYYLYNPCVVGCELTGQSSTNARNKCIHTCRDHMDIGQRDHYGVYYIAKDESPARWAEASFGEAPKHAWKVGWGPHERARYVCRVNYRDHTYFGVIKSADHRGRMHRRGFCDTFDQIKDEDTRDFHHYEVLTLNTDQYAHVWF